MCPKWHLGAWKERPTPAEPQLYPWNSSFLGGVPFLGALDGFKGRQREKPTIWGGLFGCVLFFGGFCLSRDLAAMEVRGPELSKLGVSVFGALVALAAWA